MAPKASAHCGSSAGLGTWCIIHSHSGAPPSAARDWAMHWATPAAVTSPMTHELACSPRRAMPPLVETRQLPRGKAATCTATSLSM